MSYYHTRILKLFKKIRLLDPIYASKHNVSDFAMPFVRSPALPGSML